MGFPWTLHGNLNSDYLKLAQSRITHLNDLGLLVVVYGAWGHQIDWLGREKMAEWWLQIVNALDVLNVIYCLCGESNLWIGEASKLHPNKSTDDLVASRLLSVVHPRIRSVLTRTAEWLRGYLSRSRYESRRRDWSYVLERLSERTQRPIIVHPISSETGCEAVTNPELLSANTVQTGHDAGARDRLWQFPLTLLQSDGPCKMCINLEPWYEGIRDRFGPEDQMYAYWVTMLAGATSYCYGVHGVWNVGDGRFLAHWGKQTFAQALMLDTPRLLGLSHKQYLLRSPPEGESFHQTAGEDLIAIGRRTGERLMQFFPDVARAKYVPTGRIWLPLEGTFAETLPSKGQVVIFVE